MVLFNDITYQEVFSIKLTRLNVTAYLGFFSLMLIIIVTLLIAYTPLREYIPGYPDSKMRNQIVNNAILVDSLQNQLRVQSQFINNLSKIIIGEDTQLLLHAIDTMHDFGQITFKRSVEDSLMRYTVERDEKYNLTGSKIQPRLEGLNAIHFFAPVKGVVTNSFNPSYGHYGIDLVARPNEPVLSVQKGTVIMAAWTIETGYVIQIQHSHNIISVYKHNASLLRKTGDVVEAGQAIAIIGNTGELSSGPHLHFELWYNGQPVNPEDYIIF